MQKHNLFIGQGAGCAFLPPLFAVVRLLVNLASISVGVWSQVSLLPKRCHPYLSGVCVCVYGYCDTIVLSCPGTNLEICVAIRAVV